MPELYWKEVNEPYKYTDQINGKVYEGIHKRKMVSDNPKVERMWMTGYTSQVPGSPMYSQINILGTEGQRFHHTITDEQFESLDIPEAIEFIKSL